MSLLLHAKSIDHALTQAEHLSHVCTVARQGGIRAHLPLRITMIRPQGQAQLQ